MCFDLPSTAALSSGLSSLGPASPPPPPPPHVPYHSSPKALEVRECPCCVMAQAQVCQPQCPGRRQGRRPSGKGRVKSAFQLPGKKGDGGGEREEEKQTRSVCRRHKAPHTKGPERGEGGCPGHGSSPHLRGGWGKNAGGTFLRWGQRGSLPQTRWVRSSAACLAAAAGQGGPQRALRSPVFPVNRPPTPRPPRCFLRLPLPEAAPEVPRPSLDTPRAGHTGADHVRFPLAP